MSSYHRLGIVGIGAWGCALGHRLAVDGHHVVMYGHKKESVDRIEKERTHPALARTLLAETISFTDNLDNLTSAAAILVVCPAQVMRDFCQQLAASTIDAKIPLILCAKGIDRHKGQFMTQIAREILPDTPLLVLSGPNFAHEVASGLPSAATLAIDIDDKSRSEIDAASLVEEISTSLSSRVFRVYPSTDVIGAQVAGALKNVLAIACGICEGKGLGENAKAALITRGISEMCRFSEACGGTRESLMRLCGIGDIILTCTSQTSRNMRLGYRLGKGESLQTIAADSPLTEGVVTAQSAQLLATCCDVEAPIFTAMYQILHENADIDSTIKSLLERPVASDEYLL